MEIFRLVFSLLLLSYACDSDIRKRNVFNSVWVIMMAMGIIFAGYNVVTHGVSYLISLVFSITIITAVSYIFFRMRFFGGADVKALICLAVIFPSQPVFTILSYHFPLVETPVPVFFPFTLTVIMNAAVFALVVPISLLIRNLFSL